MAEIASALSSALGYIPAGIVLVLGIIFLFVLLAKVCDEAVAPTLEYAAEWLHVPHDVACATFLALGSSAPEIFISCVSTAVHVNDTRGAQDISMGTIFGSAILAFTVIPGLCVFVSPGGFMTLQLVPLLRDAGFYSLGLILFIVFVRDGFITWGECTGLIATFIAYLISMRLLMQFYVPLVNTEHSLLQGDSQAQQSRSVDVENIPLASSSNAMPSQTSIMLAEDESCVQPMSMELQQQKDIEQQATRWYQYLLPPFGADEDKLKRRWRSILLISILYVALIAEGCLQLTTAIAAVMRIRNEHALGLILVALGAQMPDTFASLAVAKQGEGPGAVANAIGSQVMNILVGLGLPFLVSSVVRDNPVQVDFASAAGSGVALFITITALLFLACRRPLLAKIRCHREWKDSPVGLSKLDAILLLGMYLSFLVFEVALPASTTDPSNTISN